MQIRIIDKVVFDLGLRFATLASAFFTLNSFAAENCPMSGHFHAAAHAGNGSLFGCDS